MRSSWSEISDVETQLQEVEVGKSILAHGPAGSKTEQPPLADRAEERRESQDQARENDCVENEPRRWPARTGKSQPGSARDGGNKSKEIQ
jgi:hypothetical protein